MPDKTPAKMPAKPQDKSARVISNVAKTWTYQRYHGPGDPVWAIMAGDLIIALVKEKGDAMAICRQRSEVNRMTVDSRRHMIRIRALLEQNKILMAALRRITDILQRSVSPMEMLNAKSEVARVMKNVTQGGR